MGPGRRILYSRCGAPGGQVGPTPGPAAEPRVAAARQVPARRAWREAARARGVAQRRAHAAPALARDGTAGLCIPRIPPPAARVAVFRAGRRAGAPASSARGHGARVPRSSGSRRPSAAPAQAARTASLVLAQLPCGCAAYARARRPGNGITERAAAPKRALVARARACGRLACGGACARVMAPARLAAAAAGRLFRSHARRWRHRASAAASACAPPRRAVPELADVANTRQTDTRLLAPGPPRCWALRCVPPRARCRGNMAQRARAPRRAPAAKARTRLGSRQLLQNC